MTLANRSTRNWLTYTLAWVPAALLYGAGVASRPEVTWWQGIFSGAVVMGAAALAGVAVWWLSGRVAISGTSPVRFLFIHTLSALAYAATWLGVLAGWVRIVAGSEPTRYMLEQAGVWQFTTGLYIYGLIAGISYLLRTQKRLREREIAAARAEAAAARSQLSTVRANLNPHFLFNALHAVGSLVRSDPAAADLAIERLGALLRHSLDHSTREFVPLGQELEFVRGYLELEQLRLAERLRLEYALDPAALHVRVPPFLLQLLVENAVRHGVSARPEGGTIHIAANRRNGTLALRIADDGPGRRDTHATAGTGFGLEGVRQQLEAQYGSEATLRVDSTNGFAVTITLPLTAESEG